MNILNLEVKDAKITDAGEISGYGNVTGNLDRVKDRVMPGAYKGLDTLLSDGFLSKGHDWTPDGQIGYLIEAKEDANGLYFKAQFHSDDDAQRIRTRVKERMEAGKSVGLSIGYEINPDGAEFKNEGGERVRLLKSINVFEIAIAPVPCNALSVATGVKSVDDETSLSEYTDAVVDAVVVLTDRTRKRAELRAKSGRVLSQSNREMLTGCRDQMKAACESLTALIEATEPAEKSAPLPAEADDATTCELQVLAYALGLRL